MYGETSADFKIGDRVELHPATGLWMMGARYGTVVKLPRSGYVHVQLDRGHEGVATMLAPENLRPASAD